MYLLAYKVILNAKIERSIVKWGLAILGISIVQVIVYATIGGECQQTICNVDHDRHPNIFVR